MARMVGINENNRIVKPCTSRTGSEVCISASETPNLSPHPCSKLQPVRDARAMARAPYWISRSNTFGDVFSSMFGVAMADCVTIEALTIPFENHTGAHHEIPHRIP